MGRQKRKLLLSLFLGLAVVPYLFSCQGCRVAQWLSPTSSPEEELLFDVRLQAVDLPSGWHLRKESVQAKRVPGGEGRFWGFYRASAREFTWVSISETVLVYESKEEAKKGYQEQNEKYFPPGVTEWVEIDELAFSHHADEMKVACLEGYVNEIHHYTCGDVARYGRVVIVVLGNVFDDKWLTMKEFRAVLEAADRRTKAAVEGQD